MNLTDYYIEKTALPEFMVNAGRFMKRPILSNKTNPVVKPFRNFLAMYEKSMGNRHSLIQNLQNKSVKGTIYRASKPAINLAKDIRPFELPLYAPFAIAPGGNEMYMAGRAIAKKSLPISKEVMYRLPDLGHTSMSQM